MKWYYWLGGALVLALGGWYYFSERKALGEKMARVREAKALKKDYDSLNNNEDVLIRIKEEKIDPAGNELQA